MTAIIVLCYKKYELESENGSDDETLTVRINLRNEFSVTRNELQILLPCFVEYLFSGKLIDWMHLRAGDFVVEDLPTRYCDEDVITRL